MKIRVEDYEMSKEEMISKIVQLTAENAALNMKSIVLIGLLLDKGVISKDEMNTSYKNIIGLIDDAAPLHGMDAKEYIEFLKDYLGLD